MNAAHRILALCFVFVWIGHCSGQERGGTDRDIAEPLIISVLRKANVSGSLQYQGTCKNVNQFKVSQLPDYPKMRLRQSKTATALDTLREIFADDPEMRITQDKDGTIRMAESDVPRDILDVTISQVSSDGDIRTQKPVSGEPEKSQPRVFPLPDVALLRIENSPEVRAFMKSQNIRYAIMGEGISWLIGAKGPQFSGDLDNLTVSQALDLLLKTFPGFWVYENCTSETGQRMVYFTFRFDELGWYLRQHNARRPEIRSEQAPLSVFEK
jgi:hypothetical protein